MNRAKLPSLPRVETGYRIDPGRPVLTFCADVERAACPGGHHHPRGQLIYAQRGVMHVSSGKSRWIVPPSQGIWVPCNVEHQVSFPGPVSLSNLFLDPSVCDGLPTTCTVLLIHPLLRELIARAAEIGEKYTLRSREGRLMMVLVDELRQARSSPLGIPWARDERVVRVMDRLLERPGDGRELEQWARIACTSGRTLARLFVAEAGMTFGAWRKQLRLLEAVERLSTGSSVTAVALDLGYTSVSAFVAAFRRTLGDSPRRYVVRRGAGA